MQKEESFYLTTKSPIRRSLGHSETELIESAACKCGVPIGSITPRSIVTNHRRNASRVKIKFGSFIPELNIGWKGYVWVLTGEKEELFRTILLDYPSTIE